MAIHFTFCTPNIKDVRWRLLFKYYGDDIEIDDILDNFFSEHNESGSLEDQIKKLESFENIFQIKLVTGDPQWLQKVNLLQQTWVTFYAHDLEIDLMGETKDQREFSLGFSELNFHRFFNDYLNMNIGKTGRANPHLFLNAIKSAPPPFFGSTGEGDDNTITDPESGKQFSSKYFAIDEDYVANRKLKLEEICLEAIKRNDMICWRSN